MFFNNFKFSFYFRIFFKKKIQLIFLKIWKNFQNFETAKLIKCQIDV